jgi:hypothetical protein
MRQQVAISLVVATTLAITGEAAGTYRPQIRMASPRELALPYPSPHNSRADSRKPASLAVALYCGIGSSSLKACRATIRIPCREN